MTLESFTPHSNLREGLRLERSVRGGPLHVPPRVRGALLQGQIMRPQVQRTLPRRRLRLRRR